MLEEALAAGLADCGLMVAGIGLGPTPMLYFASQGVKAVDGVMVAGSHNPLDCNGFGLDLLGEPFFGDDIRDFGRIAAAADYETGEGTIEPLAVFESYVDGILEVLFRQASFKGCLGCQQWSMGEVVAAMAARLPGEHVLLNEQINGTFPNHHPDPAIPENHE